jgi:hypothetical protein
MIFSRFKHSSLFTQYGAESFVTCGYRKVTVEEFLMTAFKEIDEINLN